MNCPRCDEPMLVVDLEGVELDRCPGCAGIWLDPGEVETLCLLAGLPASRGRALLAAGSDVRGTPPAGRCPRCRRRLSAFLAPGPAVVRLDRCRWGHGVWFDRGELGSALNALCDGPAEARALADFLRAALAGELNAPPPPTD